MRVMWFTNMMLPEFAAALGLPSLNQGGWMSALAGALRRYAPHIELAIVCLGPDGSRAKVGNISYYSFGCNERGLFAHQEAQLSPRAVRRCVEEFVPDVIHVHGTEGILCALPQASLGRVPVLISMQGIITGCAPHYMGNLTEKEVRRHINVGHLLVARYSIARGAKSWRLRRGEAERRAIRQYRHFAGRTDWDRAWIRMLNPLATYYTVGEILRPEFYSVTRSVRGVAPYSIYCSAAAGYPLKGAHWLLRAVAFLKSKYPQIQLRIANAEKVARPRTFVGRLQQSQYHRYLAELMRELELFKNVVLLPSLTAAQVVEELSHAQVFCLPSLCENSPNSLGEAMLVGTPCVATYAGGIPSVLSHGEEGILCQPADPASLADAIDQVFSDEPGAARRALRARESAQLRYSPVRVVNELLAVYEELARGCREVGGSVN